MKTIILFSLILLAQLSRCFSQTPANDESVRYQQQRMVYLQWDQNKFTPKAGFLNLNPYYWLTWGLFHPDYHQTDLRPLSTLGPQTQRLAMVSVLKTTDDKYRLQSDTMGNTAISETANQSGLITTADPLWQLYYKKQLDPVLNYSTENILSGLTPLVSRKLVTEGLCNWYLNELDMLRERLDAARSTTMDRGSRIMAYHRLLMEYRTLAGIWAIRTASAQATITMTAQQQKIRTGQVTVSQWTPQTDIRIARDVLKHVQ